MDQQSWLACSCISSLCRRPFYASQLPCPRMAASPLRIVRLHALSPGLKIGTVEDQVPAEAHEGFSLYRDRLGI